MGTENYHLKLSHPRFLRHCVPGFSLISGCWWLFSHSLTFNENVAWFQQIKLRLLA